MLGVSPKYSYLQDEEAKKQAKIERKIICWKTQIHMWSDRSDWCQKEIEDLKNGRSTREYYNQLDGLGRKKIIGNFQQGIEDQKNLIQGARFKMRFLNGERAIHSGSVDMYGELIERLENLREEQAYINLTMSPKL